MDFEKTLTVINALGLLMLGFLEWNNRRKQAESQWEVGEADASEKITNAASELVNQLRTELILLRPLAPRVAQLESEVTSLRKSNERLVNWAERLVMQIQSAGLKPVPFRIDADSERMKTLPVEKPIE